jgi:hypothetical protein
VGDVAWSWDLAIGIEVRRDLARRISDGVDAELEHAVAQISERDWIERYAAINGTLAQIQRRGEIDKRNAIRKQRNGSDVRRRNVVLQVVIELIALNRRIAESTRLRRDESERTIEREEEINCECVSGRHLNYSKHIQLDFIVPESGLPDGSM